MRNSIRKNYRIISKPLRKVDAGQIAGGRPIYTDDLAPKDCLVVRLLRSTVASGEILEIDTADALKVPGIEAIYTYKDVPDKRFTNAGQTYAEFSPYDRLILDRRVRYVGDPVAIVAGEDGDCVDRALRLIKVKYNKLEPVIDMHEAKDGPNLIHPEEDWLPMVDVGGDNKRNLVCSGGNSWGDCDAVMKDCDIVVEDTFRLKANSQAMMEPFATYCEIDVYGRLHIVSSTQIVYHVRRIVGRALDIPKSKIRVTKPRIGGGFGAKQSSISEVYPAFVTWMTKKPSKIVYTRTEAQTCGSPRHEMEVKAKIGADRNGKIRAIDIYTLSNSGAYGEHGPTTVMLSGEKSISLYSQNLEAYRFSCDVVYTNVQPAGAFRGYGAPQGIFAVETLVNKLASDLGMDALDLRKLNITREGNIMHSYAGQTASSCALDRCLDRAAEMFGWREKPDMWQVDENHVRAKGMAIAMQSSGISFVDTGGATLRLTDDGTFGLLIGAADMGTGCDTILSQMACEAMDCDMRDVEVYSADTDFSPYDSGSYASSTTYVTGMAVVKAAGELKEKIIRKGAEILGLSPSEVRYQGRSNNDESGENSGRSGAASERKEKSDQYDRGRGELKIISLDGSREITLREIAENIMCGGKDVLYASVLHSSEVSPPPFMAGMCEIEMDTDTFEIKVIDFVGVVDPGTVINENLARVQTDGGILQGIGMALMENITYDEEGAICESSLMNYKIPSRTDFGRIRVDFEESFEPSGPFGAKSIGEIVINTPCPSINQAIFNILGFYMNEVPFTPDAIFKASLKKNVIKK